MQLAETTPEQRTEIYGDVRKLLHPGFLAHPVDVNGTRLVLRSFNENDWLFLQYRASDTSPVDWQRWTVATSIWMVGGQILFNDEGALQRVYEMCRTLPANILGDLYAILNALMRRVRDAADVVSGYLYEGESRYLWKAEGARLVEEGRISLGQMGLNAVQKLWVYYNRMEDEGQQETAHWEMVKFTVGPHAPKGIKKINAKDKQIAADRKRRRQQEMDRIYYETKGMIPKRKLVASDKKKYGDWNVQLAETPEELKDEMRRWVAGIKDPHDNVIDYVKAKIKTEKESEISRAKAQREALSRAVHEEGITKSQLVPMSGTAAAEFIERVKSRMPGVSKVLQDQTHNSAYEKYIKNNPDVGSLKVDENGQVTSEFEVDENMLEVLRKPEEGEKRDLQGAIEGRRPTLDSLQRDKDPKGGN